MTGSNSFWFANPGQQFYNGVATQSLRFDDDSNSYLNKTLSGSSGNQRTWTYSFWFKHGSRTSIFDFLTANASGDKYFEFSMSAAQKLTFYYHDSTLLLTTQVLRDRSAWYHIAVVHDTTQGTAANRLKIYINGKKVTAYDTNILDTGNSTTDDNNLPQNFDGGVNETGVEHLIGRNQVGNNDLDGYLSDVYLLDGTAVGDTSGVLNEFIEIKNGICIPKAYSGSYGTHGFHFDFKGTGTATSSGAVSSPTNIGDDSSGQNNHWAVSGVGTHDSNLPDSPENNFATLNFLAKLNKGANTSGTYSEGNLKIAGAGTSNQVHAYGTMRLNDFLTDGCYFEIQPTVIDASRFYLGIVNPQSIVNANDASYNFANKALVNQLNDSFSTTNTSGGNAGRPSTAFTISANDIVGVAVKGTSIWFHVNGTYSRDLSNNLGNPSTGANAVVTSITNIATEDYFPYAGYNSTFVFNFGQNPTFNGYLDGTSGKEVGTETPDDGAGVFKYAVPTGFKALCNNNLPDTGFNADEAKQPSDYFDIIKYVGNSAADDSGSTQSITGLDFEPDWIWTKNRDTASDHRTVDSTRGEQKTLYISGDGAGYTENAGGDGTDGITSFTAASSDGAGGFAVGQHTGFNKDGDDFVAWCWKLNGGSTASTTATGTTAATTMQRNTTAGISMVKYVGTGTANDTGDQVLAHGLQIGSTDTKPDMMIIKARDYNGGSWKVWHKDMGGDLSTDFLTLNTDAATSSASVKVWDGNEPTTTVFTVGMDWDVNRGLNSLGTTHAAVNYVGWFMASVDGFSKLGKYFGNGDADGTFVYTGFKPAFLMVKSIGAGENWHMFDSARSPINVIKKRLIADDTTTENPNDSILDFLSNGFKFREDNAGWNDGNYIYMAFAETPVKFANAR
jgi:hypothetical protein